MIRDEVTGKSKPAGNQVVSGLMQELRMSSGDGNALLTLCSSWMQQTLLSEQNPTGTYLGRSERGPGTEKGVVFDALKNGWIWWNPIAQQKNMYPRWYLTAGQSSQERHRLRGRAGKP